MQPTCAVTNKVVFIAKTTLEELTINAGVSQTTDILLYDREDLGRKPNILKTYKVSKKGHAICMMISYFFQDTTEVHLYNYENTLVVLERQAVENMLTSIINISHFKISIWNAKTLG